MDLKGKIAMVTGGAIRVGRAISLALAQAGCDLAIHYNRSDAPAKDLAEEVRRMGRRAEIFRADFCDAGQIKGVMEEVQKAFSRLDVLVNSASSFTPAPIGTITPDQWDHEMIVNVRAPMLMVKYALPLMSAGGAIINITDAAAEQGRPDFIAYAASKEALKSLTKSLAKALAPRNIRVNSVAPGIAEFPESASAEHKAKIISMVPLKRQGSPQYIGEAVVFLASHDYITGQNLRVDGGWNMA